MNKKLKYIILSAAFVFLSICLHAQGGKEGPPPPQQKAQNGNGPGPPCDRGDHPGQGSPPPPPPGLCLPINDYLVPLLISGILLGAFAAFKSAEIADSPETIR